MSAIDDALADDAGEEALLWVDHREEEDWLVEALSARLAPEDEMTTEWRDDDMMLLHAGTWHRLPLTMSPVDRYVAIGSVLALVKDRYAFFVENDSLEGDTHGLLVASHAELAASSEATRRALAARFTRLAPGFDHFGGGTVPYIGSAG